MLIAILILAALAAWAMISLASRLEDAENTIDLLSGEVQQLTLEVDSTTRQLARVNEETIANASSIVGLAQAVPPDVSWRVVDLELRLDDIEGSVSDLVDCVNDYMDTIGAWSRNVNSFYTYYYCSSWRF